MKERVGSFAADRFVGGYSFHDDVAISGACIDIDMRRGGKFGMAHGCVTRSESTGLQVRHHPVHQRWETSYRDRRDGVNAKEPAIESEEDLDGGEATLGCWR